MGGRYLWQKYQIKARNQSQKAEPEWARLMKACSPRHDKLAGQSASAIQVCSAAADNAVDL